MVAPKLKRSEFRDDDTGMKALVRDLVSLEKHVLKVGIVVGNTDGSKLDARSLMWDDNKEPQEDWTIVQNAQKHRALRPYMEIGFDRYNLQIENHIAKSIDEVLGGNINARGALKSIGRVTRNFMRLILDTRQVLPISEARIAEKRAIGNPDNPLINWGRMRKATNYRIERDL